MWEVKVDGALGRLGGNFDAFGLGDDGGGIVASSMIGVVLCYSVWKWRRLKINGET